jgi:Mor family transcriptional regulator
MAEANIERNIDIYKRINAGERPACLAREYGISRQRVDQIYNQMKPRIVCVQNIDGSQEVAPELQPQ